MADSRKVVEIDYTNWRGVRDTYHIIPQAIVFENNEWHPETQWLLEAEDIHKREVRTYAMKNIHSWKEVI